MTQQTRAYLKDKFRQGAKPTGTDFADLIDFIPDLNDEGNPLSNHIDGADETKHGANQIGINTSAFSKNLSPADNTTQKVAETVDNLVLNVLEWKYVGTAMTLSSGPGFGEFGFNASKDMFFLSYVLNNISGITPVQSFVNKINTGTQIIIIDAIGKMNVVEVTGPGTQGGSSAAYSGFPITTIGTINLTPNTNCLFEISVEAGGDGHAFEDSTDNVLPTRSVAKAGAGIEFEDDEVGEKTVVKTTNVVALPNIGSAAGSTQPTINSLINARLFEQIALALSGYDEDVTTDSQETLRSLPYNFKAYEIRAEFATPPTGSNAIVTFYKNGVSIGTVTIIGNTSVGTTALSYPVVFTKGNRLDVKVTQVGLTTPGATAKAYLQGIKYL